MSVERIVIDIPENFENDAKVTLNGVDVPWEKRMVRINMSEDEKREARSIYRQKHSQKEAVQVANFLRSLDPAQIAKKKAYSAQPEVKERKKELMKISRRLKRQLKLEHPRIYESLLRQIEDSQHNVSLIEDITCDGSGTEQPSEAF